MLLELCVNIVKVNVHPMCGCTPCSTCWGSPHVHQLIKQQQQTKSRKKKKSSKIFQKESKILFLAHSLESESEARASHCGITNSFEKQCCEEDKH